MPPKINQSSSPSLNNFAASGKIYVNSGASTLFYTSRLCERLGQQRGHFDLTDPNGYKWTSKYNCLHDPNLKEYLHRSVIHSHLITDGYITNEDRVICSVREFNRYNNYLAHVQLDWDHRFKMEQKELVRMLLDMQEHGKITSDVSIPDIMEWMLFEGGSVFKQNINSACSRSEEGNMEKGNSSIPRLPKIAGHSSVFGTPLSSRNMESRSEMAWKRRGRHMLNEVTEEVLRERRLERRWIIAKQERDKKRQVLHANRMATGDQKMQTSQRLSPLDGDPAKVRNALLLEAKCKTSYILNNSQLLKCKPVLKKLKPLPKIKKKFSGKSDKKSEAAGKVNHKVFSGRDSSACATCDSELYKDSGLSQLSNESQHFTPSQIISTVDQREDNLSRCIQRGDFQRRLDDVVGLAVKEVKEILIPAIHSFEKIHNTEQRPFSKDQSEHNELDRYEDLSKLVKFSQSCSYGQSQPMPEQSHNSLDNFSKEPAEALLQRYPSGSTTELCNPCIVQKAESIVWRIIYGAVDKVFTEASENQVGKKVFTEHVDASPTFEDLNEALPLADELKDQHSDISTTVKTKGIGAEMDTQANLTEAYLELSESDSTSENNFDILNNETNSEECIYLISLARANILSDEVVESTLEKVVSLIKEQGIDIECNKDFFASKDSCTKPFYHYSKRASSETLCSVSAGQEHQIWRPGEGNEKDGKLLGGRSMKKLMHPSLMLRDDLYPSEIEPYADEIVNIILHNIKENTKEECTESQTDLGRNQLIKPLSASEHFHQPENKTKLLSNLQMHQEAIRVAYEVFQSIRGQLGKIDQKNQGQKLSTRDSKSPLQNLLKQEIVESALNKLDKINVAFKEDNCVGHISNCNSPFEKNEMLRMIADNLKPKLKMVTVKPLTAVLEKVATKFGSSADVNISQNNDCPSPDGSLVDSFSSVACDITSLVLEKLVSTLGSSKCPEKSLRNLVQALAPPPTSPTELPGPQIETISDEILNIVIEQLQKVIGYDFESNSHLDCSNEAENVVKGILERFKVQEKPIYQKGPTVDHVSSCLSQTLLQNKSSVHLSDQSKRLPLKVSTSPINSHEILRNSSAKKLEHNDTEGCKEFGDFSGFGTRGHGNEKISNNVEDLKTMPLSCKAGYRQPERGVDLPLNFIQSTVEKFIHRLIDTFMIMNETEQELAPNANSKSSKEIKHPKNAFGDAQGSICNIAAQPVMDQVNLGKLSSNSDPDGNVLDITESVHALQRKPRNTAMKSRLKSKTEVKTSLLTEVHPNSIGSEEACPSLGKTQPDTVWYQAKKQMKHAFMPLESSDENLPSVEVSETKNIGSFKVSENNPTSRQGMPASDGESSNLDCLQSLPDETIEDIISSILVNIYSNYNRGTPSPGPSIADVDIIDSVLTELKGTPSNMLSHKRNELLDIPDIYKQKIAKNVHKKLLRFSDSQESLQKAVSMGQEDTVKKIASSISLEVSNIASQMVNRNDKNIEENEYVTSAVSRTDTIASWVSCAASDISEDLIIRILSLISRSQSPDMKLEGQTDLFSEDMVGDLMDAVMVELLTNPAMLTTQASESQRWRHPSFWDLENSASLVYQKMVQQNGSVEAFQDALTLRKMHVVTLLAGEVANQVYKIVSFGESNCISPLAQTMCTNDYISPIAVHSSSQNNSPQDTTHSFLSVCIGNCKAMWEVLLKVLQDLHPNIERMENNNFYADELFQCAVKQLTESTGVTVCGNKIDCDGRQHSQDAEIIRCRVEQRLKERIYSLDTKSSDLASQYRIALQSVGELVVEEILFYVPNQSPDSSSMIAMNSRCATPMPLKKENQQSINVKRIEPTSTKDSFIYTPTVACYGKRRPAIPSMKIRRHSRRGNFITAADRTDRLKEQLESKMSKQEWHSDIGVSVASQCDGYVSGRFGWLLSKLVCASEEI